MAEQRTKDLANTPSNMPSNMPWRVPVAVEDIPEAGQRYELVADAQIRAAIARMTGLRDLPRLAAEFEVTRRGSEGLHVVGRVSATAGQNCVVTLEPLDNVIEEEVDLDFMPPMAISENGEGETAAPDPAASGPGKQNREEPEPLNGGVVDLGALATEFLILGLDPYPRKPGAVFEPPEQRDRDDGPFAALSGWAKRRDAP